MKVFKYMDICMLNDVMEYSDVYNFHAYAQNGNNYDKAPTLSRDEITSNRDIFNENKIDAHTEVEICAQELYGLLDSCIQEVLTNKDADCKAVIKKAAEDYQSNFLDYEN
ncbi:MAG: hypothetical protein K5768_04890 [Firmicutes bacterium]|nr:hypothetical protein [Bacillota bacterium]